MALINVLSSEPAPLVPSGLTPEVDKFCRDLLEYLRRLNAKFPEALRVVVETGGGVVGPAGPTGPQGVQGVPGAAGADGDDGLGFSLSVDSWINWTQTDVAASGSEAFGTTANVDFEISTEDWRGRYVSSSIFSYESVPQEDPAAVFFIFVDSGITGVAGVSSGSSNFGVFVNHLNGHLFVRRFGGASTEQVLISAFAGPQKSTSDVTF